MVNSLGICEGLITRKRITKNKTEAAVLDFFVVCEQVLQFVNRMVIDEDQQYVLSNYSCKKGIFNKKNSDHNTMFLYLNLNIPVYKEERRQLFNFKNQECQETFFNLTENTTSLSDCFHNEDNIEQQSTKWLKKMNGLFQQSFRKIRITKKQKETKLSKLFDRKFFLKEKIKTSGENETVVKELTIVEEMIAKEIAEDNRNKIVEAFKTMTDTDGTANINGLWSLKRKLFPKNSKPLPVAKRNVDGRIVSSQVELKKLYWDTFRHRLRHRPIKDDLKEIEILKEELCKKRLEFSKMNKSEKWETEKLHKVLLSLKNNKSRDPQGLINEIFKPGVGGADIERSILSLFNKIKEQVSFPEFMKFVNIVCIYKGKGEKMDLKNERGIFIVNILKSIFMKMVWGEVYCTLDSNMSDSNIGGRRKKNI